VGQQRFRDDGKTAAQAPDHAFATKVFMVHHVPQVQDFAAIARAAGFNNSQVANKRGGFVPLQQFSQQNHQLVPPQFAEVFPTNSFRFKEVKDPGAVDN
jgi:hypothetical protein